MRHMQIVSVNVGVPESIQHRERTFVTGICKRPVEHEVRINVDNIEGDSICDEKHHGGRDQVVYAYSAEDYAWWNEKFDEPLVPGTFGENLTIAGLPTDLAVGDRLLIGEVVLEATAPRIPCSTLAARMADSNFGLVFRQARRPGIYFRVLNPGEVLSGDAVTFVEASGNGSDGSRVGILDLFDFAYDLTPDLGTIRRYLEAPVAERVRKTLEEKRRGLEA